MKTVYVICLVIFVCYSTKAQVGIGTTSPNPNAALDITSTNKGLLLPRVVDTNAVSNPTAGLIIYDMNMNAPAVHNGTNWRNLTTATVSQDSITYTLTGGTPTNKFTNGTFNLLSADQGVSATSTVPAFTNVSFTKVLDINSTAFIRSIGTQPVGGITIEIKFYTIGASTPYYSLKVVNAKATSYVVSNGSGKKFEEQILIQGTIYGYKDWINNTSYAWNLLMAAETFY